MEANNPKKKESKNELKTALVSFFLLINEIYLMEESEYFCIALISLLINFCNVAQSSGYPVTIEFMSRFALYRTFHL